MFIVFYALWASCLCSRLYRRWWMRSWPSRSCSCRCALEELSDEQVQELNLATLRAQGN